MNTTFSRSLLRLLPLLVLCVCCSCQAVKSSSSSVSPPKATTEGERLGDSLMETGRIDQAVAEYDKALSDGADKASISYRKGYAYFNEGQWKKALDLFQDAISQDPNMAIAYEGAGISSFQLGHFNQASDYFIDVMEHAPKHWVSYAFMAGILAAQKNARGSREMHRKALEVAGKDQFRQVNALLTETYKRGEYLVRTGMYKPGKTERSNPADAPAHNAAAQAGDMTQPDGTAEDNVYRSVKTLSPEEKEKVREQMLARLKQAKHGHAPLTTKPDEETAPKPETEPQESALEIMPLNDAEVQALLRAHKTGQIKEQQARDNAQQETAVPLAEPLPTQTVQAEQPEGEIPPAKDGDAESFVTNGQQLVTAPVLEPDDTASGEFIRDLPQSGYSAMESSFPDSDMAVQRAKELQGKGLEPYVAPVRLGDRGTWYRVMFGPYDSKKKANDMRKRLANQYGLNKAIVIKHTPH